MVLEYMAGGQITWQYRSHPKAVPVPTMSVDEARQTFRDVVLGLEYCMSFCLFHNAASF